MSLLSFNFMMQWQKIYSLNSKMPVYYLLITTLVTFSVKWRKKSCPSYILCTFCIPLPVMRKNKQQRDLHCILYIYLFDFFQLHCVSRHGIVISPSYMTFCNYSSIQSCGSNIFTYTACTWKIWDDQYPLF
jgi:hypothetical protein